MRPGLPMAVAETKPTFLSRVPPDAVDALDEAMIAGLSTIEIARMADGELRAGDPGRPPAARWQPRPPPRAARPPDPRTPGVHGAALLPEPSLGLASAAADSFV